METKSRYEVIAELEAQKRKLIAERDGLNDERIKIAETILMHDRKKDDTLVVLGRQREDLVNALGNFDRRLEDRRKTIELLIASIDESLKKFTLQ